LIDLLPESILRRMGTNETDKTPYFIYFSILILIFENICVYMKIKFIYPFYPSHLSPSVSFCIMSIPVYYYIIYLPYPSQNKYIIDIYIYLLIIEIKLKIDIEIGYL